MGTTTVQKWPSILWVLGLAGATLALLLVGVSRAETPAEVDAPVVTHAAAADGSGLAAFTTPHLHAGLTETFCLVYTATSPISTDGGIRVADAEFNGMGWAMWQRFQNKNPAESGYLTATMTGAGVTLEISRVQGISPQYPSYTTILVTSGQLNVGDEVTLCFDNGRTPHRAYRAVEWQTLTDADGNGTFAPISRPPRLNILPASTPALMVATGPTFVEKGVPFTLTVRVLDEYSNPCEEFVDTLTFTSTDTLAVLPPAASPFPPGSGVREFSITLNTLGIQYAYVTPAGPLPTINSSPFVVVDSLDAQPQLFWGDLHGHHGHVYTTTQGRRVDEYMEYARDVSDLDFCCESHKSSSYYNTMEVQAEVAASVPQYNDPGRFVTFRGYEWMGQSGTGHHNVYFSHPGLFADLIYSPDDAASDTLDELWRLLDENLPAGVEAIAPPHAFLNSNTDWHDFEELTLNRRFRPLGEVYSHWGNSEFGGSSAREALIYGNRIGFYGSSDTHFAYPGNPQTESWGDRGQDAVGGLAAVRAYTLTREALWEALTNRQTYATEGERIYLDFTVNGYPMGSEISATLAPHVVVTAAGTAPITEILVFKGTYVTGTITPGQINDYYTIITSATPGELVTSFEVTDMDFDTNAFYYVRVTQADGRRAWSSPVWVDYGSRIYLPAVLASASCAATPALSEAPVVSRAPAGGERARSSSAWVGDGAPVDLWAACGDGTLDPGEALVSCPADAQIAQRSWLTLTDGAPAVLVGDRALSGGEGTVVPMIGLYVYNAPNVTGFVPYTSTAWVPYMEEQVDRVISAGLSYLGFRDGTGVDAYQGPPYPDQGDLANPANWDWDNVDQIFHYAAQRGVYLLPTFSTSHAPGWWVESPITHTDMVQVADDGQLWRTTISFHNPEFWADVDPIYATIIAHFRDHPALLGWDVRVGQGENNYPPPYTMDIFNPPTTWCDYSPYARQRFRAWLRELYQDDVNLLRTAWMSPTVTFETVAIPRPMDQITPTTSSEMIPFVNGSADLRPEFRDWLAFRLDEKWAETQHFVELFGTLGPDHVVLNAASIPLINSDPRGGTQDGNRAYLAPSPDVFIYHPRIAHVDKAPGFNTSRSVLYNADQYAVRSGKLTIWGNEETSELTEGYDVDNIWRLDSVDIMHAAMAQGDGWVTGIEGEDDPSYMLPSWDATERAEMRRLAPIHSTPGLRPPQPEIAILADDFNDGFNYPLAGQIAAETSCDIDRREFAQRLFDNGLAYDLLTVDDVISYPAHLNDYAAVLVTNLSRLDTAVATKLAQYRDGGGGLFIAGVTGVLDGYGRPDTTALETLLGVGIAGLLTSESDIAEWQFDVDDTLVGSLLGTTVSDNLYYIPRLPPSSGFTEVAHLTSGGGEPVVGYKDKTVFWFPRLAMDGLQQLQFQKNLWSLFGVTPDVTAPGHVEATGGNYKSIFTPNPTTVDVALDDAISTTGGLVWDWNGMRLVEVVPPGPTPKITLDTGENASYFLGVTPRTDAVQFVALSGGLLGPVLDDVAAHTYAVGVYRTMPGQLVTVAICPGSWSIRSVSTISATLAGARFDPSGQVYLVTAYPLEERLTITLEYERRVYLPAVMRD
jgi:hypothetical protein